MSDTKAPREDWLNVDQLIKDHENYYLRIQNAERKCEQIKAKLMIAVEALSAISSAHKSGCVEYKGCQCWWQNAEQALAKLKGGSEE